jgi:hypothetical protein
MIILEEEAIKRLTNYLTDALPPFLQEIIDEQNDGLDLPMFAKIADDYLDPSDMFKFPVMVIFATTSDDEVKDRALDENVCVLRVMTGVVGKRSSKKSYRYHNAIREAIQRNRGLGTMGCRARVVSRRYYSAVSKGDEEIRVAESYIEITMEVQRR